MDSNGNDLALSDSNSDLGKHDDEDDEDLRDDDAAAWLLLQTKQLKRRLADAEKEIEDLQRRLFLEETETKAVRDRNARLESLVSELSGRVKLDDELSARARSLLADMRLTRMEERFRNYIRKTITSYSGFSTELKNLKTRMELVKVDLGRHVARINEEMKHGMETIAIQADLLTRQAKHMHPSNTVLNSPRPASRNTLMPTPAKTVRKRSYLEDGSEGSAVQPGNALSGSSHGGSELNLHVDINGADVEVTNGGAEEGGDEDHRVLVDGFNSSDMSIPSFAAPMQGGVVVGGGGELGGVASSVKALIESTGILCATVNAMVLQRSEFAAFKPPSIPKPTASFDIKSNLEAVLDTVNRSNTFLHHLASYDRCQALSPPQLMWDLEGHFATGAAKLSGTCRELLEAMYVHKRGRASFADIIERIDTMKKSDEEATKSKIDVADAPLGELKKHTRSHVISILSNIAHRIGLRRVFVNKRSERRKRSEETTHYSPLEDKKMHVVGTCTRCCVSVWCVDCVRTRQCVDTEGDILERLRQAHIDMNALRVQHMEWKCAWVSELRVAMEGNGLVRKVIKGEVPFGKPKVPIPPTSTNYFTTLRQRREEIEAADAAGRVMLKEGPMESFDSDDEAYPGEDSQAPRALSHIPSSSTITASSSMRNMHSHHRQNNTNYRSNGFLSMPAHLPTSRQRTAPTTMSQQQFPFHAGYFVQKQMTMEMTSVVPPGTAPQQHRRAPFPSVALPHVTLTSRERVAENTHEKRYQSVRFHTEHQQFKK
eukprot:PhF_6_TR37440/c1_g1_i4/m.55016